MARRNYDRYVRYYTVGSAAAKLEPEARKASLPRYEKPEKRKPIPFDPFAFAGTLVALVLAVLMIVGMVQVTSTTAQVQQLQTQLAGLQRQEQILQERYENGYDLDEVRAAAQSMGMIPAGEAVHVTVKLPDAPVEAPQLSWWDTFLGSLRQFFA